MSEPILDSEGLFIRSYLSMAPTSSVVALLSKRYLTLEWFANSDYRPIMDACMKYQKVNSGTPSKVALEVMVTTIVKDSDQLRACIEFIRSIPEQTPNTDWEIEFCESWAREKSTMVAIVKALDIMEKKQTTGIVDVISKAVNLKFDNSIGHDYAKAAESQYEYYHASTSRMDTGFGWLNRITRGGLPKKTLTCFLSSKTGGFKTGTMCHMAAEMYMMGYHILYISMEMSENTIRERFDAHLMQIDIDNLVKLTKPEYDDNVSKIVGRTQGSLTVKEYASGCATADTVYALVEELKSQGRKVDAVFFDYVNIGASTRLPASESGSTFVYVKAIAEELRSVAQRLDFAMITATQSNRDGVRKGNDIDLDNTSESMGLPSTVDLFIAIINSDELNARDQLTFKQLKNRIANEATNKFVTVNVNKAQMTLFDDVKLATVKIRR